MEIQKHIEYLERIMEKRKSKGFDNSIHIERVEHLKNCLAGDHEYTEMIYVDINKEAVACLWCDKVKK